MKKKSRKDSHRSFSSVRAQDDRKLPDAAIMISNICPPEINVSLAVFLLDGKDEYWDGMQSGETYTETPFHRHGEAENLTSFCFLLKQAENLGLLSLPPEVGREPELVSLPPEAAREPRSFCRRSFQETTT
ncbi:hypothetical protein IEQ34_019666 [Dendrobium chrysotoxum]|uniref:Uncharacterized protein n=1 Tax=Dendrobium chrysotoxum TaxID=161865 RepID=A0AAV7G7Z4_DENCH|nr:hypothetical protein IEQ34_019666 [Dendrobium chrysotoxum]